MNKDENARLQRYSSGILIAGTVLTLLYLGRAVLIPLVIALLLSLLAAPIVRTLRRIGMPRIGSVLVTLAIVTMACAAIGGGLGMQMLRVARSIPRYETTVQRKLRVMDEVAVGPLRMLTQEASRLAQGTDRASSIASHVDIPPGSSPLVTLAPPEMSPLLLLRKLLGSLWVPLQTSGIIFLVLTFVLLEHESLRDRFIRIAGATDIHGATLALNDAGERLSRYFVSQSVVNLGFGLAIGSILGLMHLPEAMLCGALAAVLRFVPYVGVGLAALLATALAFAVDPGWSLTAATFATFIGLDILVGQLLEPHLYGHATGLSPLSVVIAAVFWSALWGPAGLLLSTPLTLCLLIAGRYLKGLGFLELLLGNAPPLTLPQSFYQRALSGDADEILRTAREVLKRDALSTYGDCVLLPALHLAQLDAERGATTRDQQLRIRRVIIDVVDKLSTQRAASSRRHRADSVLEGLSAGQWLRRQRERSSGRWQGPLGAPPGSVVVCSGLGSPADDLAAELLVRLLRSQKADARHFSPRDLDAGLPPGADPEGVSFVYLVSAFPSRERERTDSITRRFLALLPQAHVMTVFCPGVSPAATREDPATQPTAGSLTEALRICAAWQQAREQRETPRPRELSAARSPRERRPPRGARPAARAPASPSR